MSNIGCAREGCYATICLDAKGEQRLRETHETFYCPAGHKNYFPGKTDEQKRIDRLERKLRESVSTIGRFHGQRETLIGVLRQCPICAATPWRAMPIGRNGNRRWSFEDDIARVRAWMAAHLVEAHGASLTADVGVTHA